MIQGRSKQRNILSIARYYKRMQTLITWNLAYNFIGQNLIFLFMDLIAPKQKPASVWSNRACEKGKKWFNREYCKTYIAIYLEFFGEI